MTQEQKYKKVFKNWRSQNKNAVRKAEIGEYTTL